MEQESGAMVTTDAIVQWAKDLYQKAWLHGLDVRARADCFNAGVEGLVRALSDPCGAERFFTEAKADKKVGG